MVTCGDLPEESDEEADEGVGEGENDQHFVRWIAHDGTGKIC